MESEQYPLQPGFDLVQQLKRGPYWMLLLRAILARLGSFYQLFY